MTRTYVVVDNLAARLRCGFAINGLLRGFFVLRCGKTLDGVWVNSDSVGRLDRKKRGRRIGTHLHTGQVLPSRLASHAFMHPSQKMWALDRWESVCSCTSEAISTYHCVIKPRMKSHRQRMHTFSSSSASASSLDPETRLTKYR
jgi:hypothetical protein